MSKNLTKALVIIPAWNEAETIGLTIQNVIKAVPEHDILVVDDGSTDNTVVIAKKFACEVLCLPFNMGVGGAMRAGFKYAKRKNYDFVIQLDADGQHDPHEINLVLAKLEFADIVIGARFAGKGSYPAQGLRKLAMVVLSKTVSAIAKTKLTDVTSGFRAANRKALAQYVDYYPEQYLGDTIESLVFAIKSGCTVAQVPVAMAVRQGGVPSHSPVKAALYLFRSFFALFFAVFSKGNKTVFREVED